MRDRVTLTLEPAVHLRARKLARARQTSVSGLVARLVEDAPLSERPRNASFASRWTGKFQVAKPDHPDPRFKALAAKYRLTDA